MCDSKLHTIKLDLNSLPYLYQSFNFLVLFRGRKVPCLGAQKEGLRKDFSVTSSDEMS